MKTKLRAFLPAIVIVLLLVLFFSVLLWYFVFGPSYMLSAIERGDVRKITLLGHLGVNPNSDVWLVGGLMHCAAAAGQVEAMAKLQQLGASVNRLDGYGDTPAQAAVFADQVQALRWLLAHGADPSITNRDGYTVAEYVTNQFGLSESQKRELIAVLKAPTKPSEVSSKPSNGAK